MAFRFLLDISNSRGLICQLFLLDETNNLLHGIVGDGEGSLLRAWVDNVVCQKRADWISIALKKRWNAARIQCEARNHRSQNRLQIST